MTHLFNSQQILYVCTCGLKKPLTKIYFCRHCVLLRCGDCVSHEIDSHYCSNCLESMPSAEARLKKNRCSNCYNCPCCNHILVTRATIVEAPSEEKGNLISHKFYYLWCDFCRWCSRDSNLPDQNIASGNWSTMESPYESRVLELIDYYSALVHWQKMNAEFKKILKRRPFQYLSDKYRLSTVTARKRVGLLPLVSSYSKEGNKLPEVSESVPESLSEISSPQKLDANLATTINQRLACPGYQPQIVTQLHPQRKLLTVKKSQRCKTCEHNLCKPEYHPSSIKFKIHYHVPEIRLLHPLCLEREKLCSVVLTLRNPTQYEMHVQLLPLLENTSETDKRNKIILPKEEIVISGKDDTTEFDDYVIPNNCVTDGKSILWHQGNKVAILIYFNAIDLVNNSFSLLMQYNYVNSLVNPSESLIVKIPVVVYVIKQNK